MYSGAALVLLANVAAVAAAWAGMKQQTLQWTPTVAPRHHPDTEDGRVHDQSGRGQDVLTKENVKDVVRNETERAVEKEIVEDEHVRKEVKDLAKKEAEQAIEDKEEEIKKEVVEQVRKEVDEDLKKEEDDEQLSKSGSKVLSRSWTWTLVMTFAGFAGLLFLTFCLILMAFQWDRESVAPSRDRAGIREVLTALLFRKRNGLLLMVPFAAMAQHFELSIMSICFCFLSILGLALFAELVVEDLAAARHSSWFLPIVMAGITAWLETAMIFQSIYMHATTMAKGSLIGFVLHNILFSIGMLFMAGNLNGQKLVPKVDLNRVLANLQLLVLFGIMLLGIHSFARSAALTAEQDVRLSLITSTIMLIVFAAWLIFVISAHTRDDASASRAGVLAPCLDQGPVIPSGLAGAILVVVAAGVYIVSGYMVRSLEQVTQNVDVSQTFAAVILLPSTTGCAELLVALMLVRSGKQDMIFGLELLLTSASQTAFFVVPSTVIVSFMIPGEAISLDFIPLYAGSLVGATIWVHVIVTDLHWDWWRGVMLLSFYCVLALMFLLSPDEAVLTVEK